MITKIQTKIHNIEATKCISAATQICHALLPDGAMFGTEALEIVEKNVYDPFHSVLPIVRAFLTLQDEHFMFALDNSKRLIIWTVESNISEHIDKFMSGDVSYDKDGNEYTTA